MKTRCKFRCHLVEPNKDAGGCFVAKFHPVYSGSPENDAFFKATPAGDLTLYTVKDAKFEVGKLYYLDITLAEEGA